MLQFNKSSEKQLSVLICTLDDNPVLKVEKTFIEEVSYLGFNYFRDSEDFREKIQSAYDGFINHIKYYIQSNDTTIEFHPHIASTLSLLLANYQDAHKRFTKSTLRREWKTLSQSFLLPYPPHSYAYKAEETMFRNIYDFFFKMSSIQLEFIDYVISHLTQELLPFKDVIQDNPPSKSIALTQESEQVYFFKLTKEASLTSHLTLSKIHKNLKRLGYIDCTLPDFKRLFINYPYIIPSTTPPAIVWHCEHYNHLAYFIHCLISGKFISHAKKPANSIIALNLFYDRKEGNFYSPSKVRFDSRINPIDKAKIDSLIKDSGLNLK